MIRIVAPDIGGGFGNKVPVYPGYVASILASILLERPVKWIEDRTGNLISTGFARDIYLHGELALRQGRADPRGADEDDRRSRRLLLRRSAVEVQDRAHALGVRLLRHPQRPSPGAGVYTNKAPGGVAYRCSFRVTEAMFFQERMVQAAADDLGMDQAEFRRVNFVRDDDFPHRTP